MVNQNDTRMLAPEFFVRISGADLPPQALADLISASVHEDTGAPTMFTLQLINWDMAQLKVTWSDHELFTEGSKVEIQIFAIPN